MLTPVLQYNEAVDLLVDLVKDTQEMIRMNDTVSRTGITGSQQCMKLKTIHGARQRANTKNTFEAVS